MIFLICIFLLLSSMFDPGREAISKTRASCFTGVSKHSKRIKFSRVWKPQLTLALVFEILLKNLKPF